MSLVLRRSYLKAKNNVLPTPRNSNTSTFSPSLITQFFRNFSEDKSSSPEFINSTILIENGLNVQELPVVVRKLKDISEIDQKSVVEKPSQDPGSYHMIQAEFKQCVDLRDVFSLLSKCTKITPNIALGAMERIYDIEKNPNPLAFDSNMHVNLAKGAILDKLLKVVMKTEDTQTILNILNTVSTFMEPYKYKCCDELLFRVIENKLSVEQLCSFTTFLISNKADPKYSETIDKLWVGFVTREKDINETNIVELFKVLPGLKTSKKTILTLLEQKLSDLWSKTKVPVMIEILQVFVDEKYSSLQSFDVIGRWFHTNIHSFDEDSLLNVITKLTRLHYTDDQVESAVEKYMKLKATKIESYILIVGILNYCMQFKIRNKDILNVCSNYLLRKGDIIPPSFLRSFIYPFGYLCFQPENSTEFWTTAERLLQDKFEKITANDLSSIILSFLYSSQYPLKLVDKIFSSEYLVKVNSPEVLKKLHLIDTSLTLECGGYTGPMMPKDQWSKPISQDRRIKNIIEKVRDSIVTVVGEDKFSTAVLIPFLYSDETYLIDVMVHPAGQGSSTFNWKLKSAKNENIAILVHLPDHYCSDNEHLVGPQMLKKKHLKLLGMKVTSLKYSTISQFYTTFNTAGLRTYILDSITKAEPCL